MEIVLTKEWIKIRKAFLRNEYRNVADDISDLKDKLIEAEDSLNDITAEIEDLDSLKGKGTLI